MVFSRFVELGRVVVINRGAFTGKVAVVVEIVDHNRVLVDGPQALTGVARHVACVGHLTLTDIVVPKVTRGMTHAKLCVRFQQEGVLRKYGKSAQGLRQTRLSLRKGMTDFDSFRVKAAMKKLDGAARLKAHAALKTKQ